MENKHFIIFIGIILIVLMLLSLNKEDSNKTTEPINDSIENNNVELSTEEKYAPVNNNYSSNDSETEDTVTKKHITTYASNQNEPR